MNIKQSFRILFRNKTYSLLNIAGLGVGIACAALIFLWVEDEVTFDKFPKSKNLYYVGLTRTNDENMTQTGFYSSALLAEAVQNVVPGVKRTSRIAGKHTRHWEQGENIFPETGAFVDSTFFTMFDVHFIFGNKETAFIDELSVVISKSLADKLFGNENPVGKTLKMNDVLHADIPITGVYSDIRKNSKFNFDWMLPLEVYRQEISKERMNLYQWGMNYMHTIIELEKNVNPATVDEQIQHLYMQTPNRMSGVGTFFLYPQNRMHLYGEFSDGKESGKGYITTVRTITGIALIVLLIACINFINLATARSQKRTLEVGVRKTFGGSRIKLISQFMAESALITFLSLTLAIAIILLVLPFYNTLISKQLVLSFGKLAHWGGILGVGILCCLLAGSYPALYLSSFPSIDMLKRMKTKNSAEAWLRKGLVVFQFSVSLALIICTMFVYLQLQHVKNRPLGMDFNQVLTISASDEMKRNFAPLKNSLLTTGVVDEVSISGSPIIEIWHRRGGMDWHGKPDNYSPLVRFSATGSGIVSLLGLELLEGGRDFDDSMHPSGYVIINETFAEMMGEEGRVGGRIRHGYDAEIVGIVKNFVFNDMYSVEQQPVILLYNPNETSMLLVKLKTDNMQAALSSISAVVQQFNPIRSFDYQFMDERFNQLFKREQFTGKLALLFAALAIFISCLGLFGLTAFSAEQRTREIGVRKVLGASVWSIIQLLGRNFLILILISFVVAIPIARLLVQRWLNDFAYRIDISWTVFAGACLLVTLVAMLTVCAIALRAAMTDPVKAIKSE